MAIPTREPGAAPATTTAAVLWYNVGSETPAQRDITLRNVGTPRLTFDAREHWAPLRIVQREPYRLGVLLKRDGTSGSEPFEVTDKMLQDNRVVTTAALSQRLEQKVADAFQHILSYPESQIEDSQYASSECMPSQLRTEPDTAAQPTTHVPWIAVVKRGKSEALLRSAQRMYFITQKGDVAREPRPVNTLTRMPHVMSPEYELVSWLVPQGQPLPRHPSVVWSFTCNYNQPVAAIRAQEKATRGVVKQYFQESLRVPPAAGTVRGGSRERSSSGLWWIVQQ